MDILLDFAALVVYGCVVSFVMVVFKRLIYSGRDSIG